MVACAGEQMAETSQSERALGVAGDRLISQQTLRPREPGKPWLCRPRGGCPRGPPEPDEPEHSRAALSVGLSLRVHTWRDEVSSMRQIFVECLLSAKKWGWEVKQCDRVPPAVMDRSTDEQHRVSQ